MGGAETMTITEKGASAIWWICVTLGAFIIAYYSYLRDLSGSPQLGLFYPIITGIFMFLMTIGLGAMAGSNLSPKGKIIGGICWALILQILGVFLAP